MGKRVGALVTVALLLSGAACSSSGSTPLSKAEFAKQAGAICDRVTKETNSLIPDDISTTKPKELAADFDKFADFSNKAITDLKGLNAPKAQDDDVKAALGLQQQATDKLKAIADDLRAGKAVPDSRYKEIGTVGDKSNAAFDKAGLKKCGSQSGG